MLGFHFGRRIPDPASGGGGAVGVLVAHVVVDGAVGEGSRRGRVLAAEGGLVVGADRDAGGGDEGAEVLFAGDGAVAVEEGEFAPEAHCLWSVEVRTLRVRVRVRARAGGLGVGLVVSMVLVIVETFDIDSRLGMIRAVDKLQVFLVI